MQFIINYMKDSVTAKRVDFFSEINRVSTSIRHLKEKFEQLCMWSSFYTITL